MDHATIVVDRNLFDLRAPTHHGDGGVKLRRKRIEKEMEKEMEKKGQAVSLYRQG